MLDWDKDLKCLILLDVFDTSTQKKTFMSKIHGINSIENNWYKEFLYYVNSLDKK